MVQGVSNEVLESHIHREKLPGPLVDRCARAGYYLLPPSDGFYVWRFRAHLFSGLSP